MIASNLLCEPLVPIYSDFSELKSEYFKGYKLVEKSNLNYYSIVSGLFRYKEGRIKHSSYTPLYEKNPQFYNEELRDRVSIFRTPEDARKFLKEYVEICKRDSNLVILEIKISGNLKSAKCSNKYVTNFDCVIGDCMDSIREI